MHEKDLHKERAHNIIRDTLRDKMKYDSFETKMITFVVQKTLPLPYLQANDIYHKRQQNNMYNLSIHSYPQNQVIMSVWSDGKRDSEDIASCIPEYCEENMTVREIS